MKLRLAHLKICMSFQLKLDQKADKTLSNTLFKLMMMLNMTGVRNTFQPKIQESLLNFLTKIQSIIHSCKCSLSSAMTKQPKSVKLPPPVWSTYLKNSMTTSTSKTQQQKLLRKTSFKLRLLRGDSCLFTCVEKP